MSGFRKINFRIGQLKQGRSSEVKKLTSHRLTMKRSNEHKPEGYLSDESSFYGDSPTRLAFEEEVKQFDVSVWWKNKHISPTALADKSLAASLVAEKSKVTATLHNPYEGDWSGRQLHETIDDFLERVPPSTTPVSDEVHWIWIANPFVESRPASSKTAGEGPEKPEAEWAQFITEGEILLEEFENSKKEIEKQKAGEIMAISRAVGRVREDTVKKLQNLAAELHCTTGKWLLFSSADEVDVIWKVVARGTAQGDLGIAAKVAPDDGDMSRARVICIYTKDFTDLEDVGRVAKQMKELGLIDTRGRPVHYKCDAYTHLQLNSGNEYGIKASLYSSNEILKPNERKLETFWGKRKRND